MNKLPKSGTRATKDMGDSTWIVEPPYCVKDGFLTEESVTLNPNSCGVSLEYSQYSLLKSKGMVEDFSSLDVGYETNLCSFANKWGLLGYSKLNVHTYENHNRQEPLDWIQQHVDTVKMTLNLLYLANSTKSSKKNQSSREEIDKYITQKVKPLVENIDVSQPKLRDDMMHSGGLTLSKKQEHSYLRKSDTFAVAPNYMSLEKEISGKLIVIQENNRPIDSAKIANKLADMIINDNININKHQKISTLIAAIYWHISKSRNQYIECASCNQFFIPKTSSQHVCKEGRHRGGNIN